MFTPILYTVVKRETKTPAERVLSAEKCTQCRIDTRKFKKVTGMTNNTNYT